MAKKWSDKFSTIYESKVKLEDAFEWRIALEENKEKSKKEEVKNETKKETTTEALNGAASFIRGKLSERVEVRHTPELKFIYDTSIEYGNHIDKIIESINKEENNE